MEKISIGVGVILGIVIAAGIIGTGAAVDEFRGVGTPNVTVERINATHAAVTWTTEKPTRGYLKTSVARQCGPAWGRRKTINRIDDSEISRTHLIVASIYDLNESRVNLANVPGNGSLRWYQVEAVTTSEREVVPTTIIERNLSRACR